MKRRVKENNASLKDYALAGSIIGNIFQAINQAETKNDLNIASQRLQELVKHKDSLVHLINNLQQRNLAHHQKAKELETKILSLENRLLSYEKTLNSLKNELHAKDAKIELLKALTDKEPYERKA